MLGRVYVVPSFCAVVCVVLGEAPPAAPPGTFFDQGPGGATAWVPNTSDEDDAATV